MMKLLNTILNFWKKHWFALLTIAIGIAVPLFIHFDSKEEVKKQGIPTSIATNSNVNESQLIIKTPFIGSISSPTNIPLLSVMNKNKNKKYNLSSDISAGDIIWFEIHSVANKAPLQNLRHKIANLHNKIFDADTSANIVAKVSATGVPTLNGSVSLHFNNRVKLEYAGYQWHTRKLQANSNESKKELSSDQHGSFLLQSGVLLGSLATNYQSNFLVKFKAVEVE